VRRERPQGIPLRRKRPRTRALHRHGGCDHARDRGSQIARPALSIMLSVLFAEWMLRWPEKLKASPKFRLLRGLLRTYSPHVGIATLIADETSAAGWAVPRGSWGVISPTLAPASCPSAAWAFPVPSFSHVRDIAAARTRQAAFSLSAKYEESGGCSAEQKTADPLCRHLRFSPVAEVAEAGAAGAGGEDGGA
jgi:hypothetical protein